MCLGRDRNRHDLLWLGRGNLDNLCACLNKNREPGFCVCPSDDKHETSEHGMPRCAKWRRQQAKAWQAYWAAVPQWTKQLKETVNYYRANPNQVGIIPISPKREQRQQLLAWDFGHGATWPAIMGQQTTNLNPTIRQCMQIIGWQHVSSAWTNSGMPFLCVLSMGKNNLPLLLTWGLQPSLTPSVPTLSGVLTM